MKSFFESEITDVALIHSLSALDLGRQYVCKTQKACNNLEIVSEKCFNEFELAIIRDKSIERREQGIALTENVLLKYRREGKFFDEIIRGGCNMLNTLQAALSDMQGQLFEMSVLKGLDSETFIKAFMNSDIATDIDSHFNHMQWAGKEYIMERILDELKNELVKGGEVYDKETMYWAGYIYRRWHYYTGETSKEIYKQAPAKTMRITYMPYHSLSEEMAIDRLRESYSEKHKKRSKKN